MLHNSTFLMWIVLIPLYLSMTHDEIISVKIFLNVIGEVKHGFATLF